MDILSVIGLLLALVAIIGGNHLEGGHIGALVNGPAALIVVGGTLGQPSSRLRWRFSNAPWPCSAGCSVHPVRHFARA